MYAFGYSIVVLLIFSLLLTFLGLALTYILENSFKPESGARSNVPKIGILVTDGKSQDDILPPAESLRDAGVELFAIGIRGFFICISLSYVLNLYSYHCM